MSKSISVLYLYLDQPNGYGNSAKSVYTALSKIEGVEVDLVPLNKPNIQREKQLQDTYDIGIVHISTNSLIQDYKSTGYITLCLSRCKKKFQYFLWETDEIPHAYTEFFAKTNVIDGFICPSHFCADLVSQFGKETHYVPITVDVDYNKKQRKSDKSKFTVLTVAQMSVRKAIDMSVCAYATAFAGKNDVEYYIKIGESLDNVDPGQLIKANVSRSMVQNPPPIYLLTNNLSEEEMSSLYLSSDCYLHLSRGEGFGITPLTAINYGLPVIYSDWSAHTEFLKKSKDSIPVDGRIDLVHSMDPKFGFHPGMKWFEVNVASAVSALRKAYDRWKNQSEKYAAPAVVKEYKQDAIYNNLGKVVGIDDVKIKEDKKIDGMTVVEL